MYIKNKSLVLIIQILSLTEFSYFLQGRMTKVTPT